MVQAVLSMFIMADRDKHKHKRSDSSFDASNEHIRKKKHRHGCVLIFVTKIVLNVYTGMYNSQTVQILDLQYTRIQQVNGIGLDTGEYFELYIFKNLKQIA